MNLHTYFFTQALLFLLMSCPKVTTCMHMQQSHVTLPLALQQKIVERTLTCRPLPPLTMWLMSKNDAKNLFKSTTLMSKVYKKEPVTSKNIALSSDDTKIACTYWPEVCLESMAIAGAIGGGAGRAREYIRGTPQIAIFDICSHTLLNTIPSGHGTPPKVHFCTGRQPYIVVEGEYPTVWDYESMNHYQLPSHMTHCFFMNNNRAIAGLLTSDTIEQFDLITKTKRATYILPDKIKYFNVCSHTDFPERDFIISQLRNNTVYVLNNSLKPMAEFKNEQYLAHSSHGALLCTRNIENGDIYIRSIPGFQLQKTIACPNCTIKSAQITSNNKKLFVVCQHPAKIYVFDINAGKLCTSIVRADIDLIGVNDKGTIAHIKTNSTIATWHVKKRLLTHKIQLNNGSVPVAFDQENIVLLKNDNGRLYEYEWQPDIVQLLSTLKIDQLKILNWIYHAALKHDKFNISSDSPAITHARKVYHSLPSAIKRIVSPHVNLPSTLFNILPCTPCTIM